jgi:hypothetical protein
MRHTFFLLILFLCQVLITYSQSTWPFEIADTHYPVIGTFGEYSDDGIKSGIDIYIRSGEPVYSIEGGDVSVNGATVVVGRFTYQNLTRIQVISGTIDKRVLLGYVDEKNFLHVKEKENGIFVNPLRKNKGLAYIDKVPPVIMNVILVKQDVENADSKLYGTYDIVVDAYDPASWNSNDLVGNPAYKCGIYKIEIQFFDKNMEPIKDVNGNVVIGYHTGYDQLPSCNREIVYGAGSTPDKFLYIATNDPYLDPNIPNDAYDKYWNTRQKKGSINLDENAVIPSQARFPEGEINIKVIVSDINNNSAEYILNTEEQHYAAISELSAPALGISGPIWKVDGKSTTINPIMLPSSTELALNPKFKILSKNVPDNTIQIKGSYVLGTTTGEIQAVPGISTGGFVNTEIDAIKIPITATFSQGTLQLTWVITFDGGTKWASAGISENSLTQLHFKITDGTNQKEIPANSSAYFMVQDNKNVAIEVFDDAGNKINNVKWNSEGQIKDKLDFPISQISSSADGTEIMATVCGIRLKFNLVVAKLDLTEVLFVGLNSNGIYKDIDGTPYLNPLWTTALQKPVSFVRNTKLQAYAKFQVSPAIKGPLSVWVKGTGTKGYNMGKIKIDVPSGQTIAQLPTPLIESVIELENDIDLIPNFQLDWQASFDETNWEMVGTSTNKLYVTLEKPVAHKLYETLLDISCRNATGIGDVAIAPGTNKQLETIPQGDDKIEERIKAGTNGICETQVSGDDLQIIAKEDVGLVVITSGNDGILQSVPQGDDFIEKRILVGVDNICNTQVSGDDIQVIDKDKKNTDVVVEKIWGDFMSLSVKRVDGVEMKYWNPVNEVDPSDPSFIPKTQNITGLLQLSNGNGSCVAWSQLFHETLDAIGIIGSEIYMVGVNKNAPLIVGNTGISGSFGFFVKNWSFDNHILPGGTNGNFDSNMDVHDILYINVICPGSDGVLNTTRHGNDISHDGILTHDPTYYPYKYIWNVDCAESQGIPGQMNGNPPEAFPFHWLVKYNKKVYDPSYGSQPFSGVRDGEAEHENASIDGIYVEYHPTSNEMYQFVIKNDPMIDEHFLEYIHDPNKE